LINSTSLSIDTERELIKKIGTLCGKANVTKYETMISDLTLSDEYNKGHSHNDENFAYRALVLTKGNWPAMGDGDNTILPEEFEKFTKSFEKYYGSRSSFEKRVITWIPSEGKCELVMKVGASRYLLEAKTHQACILLQFNKEKTITFQSLKGLTNMREDLLIEYLKFLCYPLGILKRRKEANDPFLYNEELEFNADFKSKGKRVILFDKKLAKTVADKLNPVENEKDMKALDKERGFYIDAVTVRVMKHRKALKYTSLIDEVIRMCTIFHPNIPLIKRRIERLIDDAYLKRDEDNLDTLVYVP